jgi:hypothetical protein
MPLSESRVCSTWDSRMTPCRRALSAAGGGAGYEKLKHPCEPMAGSTMSRQAPQRASRAAGLLMAAAFSSSILYLYGFLQHHYKISVHFSRILSSQAPTHPQNSIFEGGHLAIRGTAGPPLPMLNRAAATLPTLLLDAHGILLVVLLRLAGCPACWRDIRNVAPRINFRQIPMPFSASAFRNIESL